MILGLPIVAAFALFAAAPADDPAVEAETRAWHEGRLSRLKAEDGWLSLVGLSWLKDGENTAGSAKGSAVKLPASAPASVGTFHVSGAEVKFTAAPGVTVTKDGAPFAGGPVRTDAEGKPDVLALGTVKFQVIDRGGRLGVRVKDSAADARTHFKGIERFPAKGAWRVEAKLVPNKEPKTIAIPTVLNTVERMSSPGTLVFKVNGKEHRLDPVLEEGSDELFIIFGDQTNRDATYGAGRFVYAKLDPSKQTVTIDFNKAYNPPCAFTAYATCPLPPRQNKLAVRIEAGEKRYASGKH